MKLPTTQTILLLALSWTSETAAKKKLTAKQLLKGGGKRGGKSSSRGKHVRAGEPATFEFLITYEDCLSFGSFDKGEKAELQDCDDATEFIYREDSLVQAYRTNKKGDLCLNASYDLPTLEECDPDNQDQEWLFVRVAARSSRTIYRLKSTGNGRFLEVEKDGKFSFAGGNDEAQWFVGPHGDFFEATNPN